MDITNMKGRDMSTRVGLIALLLVVGAFLLGAGVWPTSGPVLAQTEVRPRPKNSGDAPSREDQAAIRAAMQSFIKAFDARDAKGLAAHWTAQGEYHNDQGKSAHGRDALEKGFARFFARTP